MSNFVNTCIYTDKALKKINNILVGGDNDFTISKIIISSSSTELNTETSELTNIYLTLPIDSIERPNPYSVSIKATIPAEILGINMKSIGLISTPTTGNDELLAYCNLDLTKPDDLPFELVIVLDFLLKTVNLYPTDPNVTVVVKEKLKKKDYDEVNLALLDSTINMEKSVNIIDTQLGYNQAQVFYREQRALNRELDNFTDAQQYNALCKFFNYEHIDDCFNFISNDYYTFYTSRNLADTTQTTSVYNKKITSQNNDVRFDKPNGASVMIFTKLGGQDSGVILSKALNMSTYFSLSINVLEVIFILTMDALGNSIRGTVTLTIPEFRKLYINYALITLTYNNDPSDPEFKMYINDSEVNTNWTYTPVGTEFPTLHEYSSLPMVNYATINGEVVSDLIGSNSYSKIISLDKVATASDIQGVLKILNFNKF